MGDCGQPAVRALRSQGPEFSQAHHGFYSGSILPVIDIKRQSPKVENLRILFALPWSRHLAPGWTGWTKQQQVVGETQELVREIVREHRVTWEEGSKRDLVDVYLGELGAGGADFTEEQLVVNAMDLFR